MSGDVLKADQAGEAKANTFNTVQTEQFAKGLQQWGLVPGVGMPMDHVYERQEFFRSEIERTLTKGPNVAFMDDDKIKHSNALKTQQKMLGNYISDSQLLPQAEMAFNTWTQLANNAAHAAVKTDEVGSQLGINTQKPVGEVLDPTHAAALKSAVIASEKSGGLRNATSVESAQSAVLSKRQLFMAATIDLSQFMTKDIVSKLRGELDDAQKEKKEIFEKIERAEKIGQAIEFAGSMVSGGAGAIEMVGAHSAVGAAAGAGDTLEAGGGLIGSAVTGIATLYHEDKLRELDAKIASAETAINEWQLTAERSQLTAKKQTLSAAASEYKTAVSNYQNAMNDRRMAFASIGQDADKAANKGKPAKKADQVDSAVMLWIESLMETKSQLGMATESGKQAQAEITSVSNQVLDHRNMGWSNIDDIWGVGSSGGTRREDGGPEVAAVASMRRLNENWLRGAETLKTRVDSAVGDSKSMDNTGAGTMGKAGFTESF